MSKAAKIGVVFLNMVGVIILVVSIIDDELRAPGIIAVAVAMLIWERTRESHQS